MSATAYLLVVIDTATCAVVGVDIFSEPEPTLGPRRVCGILTEVSAETYDAAHRSLVNEIATSRRWAWALPHLGRCKREVEAILAERGQGIAKAAPAPGKDVAPTTDARPTVVRCCLPENGSYQLVELAGSKFRIAAYVTACPTGGFIFEEVRADGTHAEPHYVGASAVYQMWPCSKPVALATAAQLGSRALDLPTWAVVPPPPRPPIPVPVEGQVISFDGWKGHFPILSVVGGKTVVVRNPNGDVIGIDLADPRHARDLRWIGTSAGFVVWERSDGLHESDILPF